MKADPIALQAPTRIELVHGYPASVPVAITWATKVKPSAVEVTALGAPAQGKPPPGARFESLRALYPLVTERDWVLAGRAVQLVEWRRTHRFCGRCGTETGPAAGERARRCPACGLLAFPRLSPAVIVLVERDGRILLANGRGFGIPMYSTLAGFVEPGETLEEAAAREVHEEVAVRVDRIRYFGSQPWPVPNSLMVGFTARWAGGEIDIDEADRRLS